MQRTKKTTPINKHKNAVIYLTDLVERGPFSPATNLEPIKLPHISVSKRMIPSE